VLLEIANVDFLKPTSGQVLRSKELQFLLSVFSFFES